MKRLIMFCVLLLAACPTPDFEARWALDCTDLQDLRVLNAAEVAIVYRVAAATDVRLTVRPVEAASFEVNDLTLAPTGANTSQVERILLTAQLVGEAELVLFRDAEELATCDVRFIPNEDPIEVLDVTVVGEGTVASLPPVIDCPVGTCMAMFTQGSTVTLQAFPAVEWAFGGYFGDCSDTLGVTAKILMDRSKSCTVRFVRRAEFISVPAGSFYRGCGSGICPGDAPLTEVTLDAYSISRTETSVEEYRACVHSGRCSEPSRAQTGEAPCTFWEADREQHPVNCVSWSQSQSFCEFIGGRLPTAAEWERAARGDIDERVFPWGNFSPTCMQANVIRVPFEICEGDTIAVGGRMAGASPFGVLDMAGNVEEWVRDWYDPNYYGDPASLNNPIGPSTSLFGHREVRGGSYSLIEGFGRVYERARHTLPFTPSADRGFRCVLDSF